MRLLSSIFLLFFTALTLDAQQLNVLVFSETKGFRHASIEAGQAMFQSLAQQKDFIVDFSENSEVFASENLSNYDCVVFLSTTGNVLNQAEQDAFESYIASGGGFVGIHAASDTEYNWPWYGGLVGAYFDSHPATQDATIEVADKVHPSTENLPQYWSRRDEWYNFNTNPRGEVHVLATLDESSYSGGNMGHDHPIAWCHEYEGGRSWYTAGGHTSESYNEADFINHIYGGILYASGKINGDFTATMSEKFELKVIDDAPLSPMALEVLPNLNVLYIERAGKVKEWDASSSLIKTIATLDVDSGREDGLIGITIDPRFEENQWVYLFYSPTDFDIQRISRFKYNSESLDMDSEQVILEIPVQRNQCCHSGGDLEFDIDGNLWIATGDNVNPFQSEGYAPIDERPGRAAFDAQGTSPNTKDLRGKILRIRPGEDGGYTVPVGNLFDNEDEGLPEIYVMGVRNAFRIAVDDQGTLVWGDVGPDANSNSAIRGPRGYDELNKTEIPGNFGWPYAVADNKAYFDFNFDTGQSGDLFDLENLLNNSPNNTGPESIPKALPAWIFYHSGNNANRPELNAPGGRSILGGTFFRYQSERGDTLGLPKYFDNTLIIGDWSRNWIKEVRIDDKGDLLQINPLIPHIELNSPIDIAIGPDGNLYIAEWGSGFTNDNEDARIIKIIYNSIAGNQAPSANFTTDKVSGLAPLTIEFDASLSEDPDIGDEISYSWDFDNDGMEDDDRESFSFTFAENGIYDVSLQVTDREGLQATVQKRIVVGNSQPQIEIVYPPNGGFFSVGDTIMYDVITIDPEDGNECERNLPLGITIEPAIGHDDHAHGEGGNDECTGAFITMPHGDFSDDVFYVLNASYEDRGGEVQFPLSAQAFHILQPRVKQAQHFQGSFDIRSESTGDFLGGGLNMAFINDGSYLEYGPVHLEEIDYLTIRWASRNHISDIEIRIDSTDGRLIGSRSLPVTGDWQDYDYFTMELDTISGTHNLFLIFRKPGFGGLGNINFMEFHGKGVATSDPQVGMGLTASYFANADFTNKVVERNEPMVSWNWGNDSPVEEVSNDGFSVIWEGELLPETSGPYTLSVEHTSGTADLLLNGLKVNDATLDLEANVAYPIELKYSHTEGEANIALRWEGPQPKNVIHTRYLRSKVAETSSVADKTKSLISIYPSPFSDRIYVEGISSGTVYRIRTIEGKVIMKGRLEGYVDTQSIQAGTYLLEIDEQVYKVVKSE